ncbi:MAG: hypothetical protein WD889_02300 [Candidatus Colwellbacteria bacterium]
MERYAATLAALCVAGVLGIAPRFELGRFLLKKHIRLIFLASVIIIFSLIGYAAVRQYLFWLQDPLARFLLPPYQNFNYFALYALARFFGPYLISLGLALLFLQAAKIINRRRGELLFEQEEPYLAAASIFLTGHPGWLIYSILLLVIYLLLHLVSRLRGAKDIRLPLYRLWAPIAFFVILLNTYWFSQTGWWQLLVI